MTAVYTWPEQARDWMDDRGKPAWIFAMVIGFIFFWNKTFININFYRLTSDIFILTTLGPLITKD